MGQKITWNFKLPIQPFLKPTWLLLKRGRGRRRRRHQRQRRIPRKNPRKYEGGFSCFWRILKLVLLPWLTYPFVFTMTLILWPDECYASPIFLGKCRGKKGRGRILEFQELKNIWVCYLFSHFSLKEKRFEIYMWFYCGIFWKFCILSSLKP